MWPSRPSGSRSPGTRSSRGALLPHVERPLLVGGSGLYFRAIVDGLVFPPEDAEVRRSLETELAVLGAARLHDRLRWTDPAAAEKIDAPNARRTVRALEVAALTGEPFSSFAEPWTRYDPASVRAVGIRIDRAAMAARSEARVHAMLDAGWLEEVTGLVARGLGWMAHRLAGDRLRGVRAAPRR